MDNCNLKLGTIQFDRRKKQTVFTTNATKTQFDGILLRSRSLIDTISVIKKEIASSVWSISYTWFNNLSFTI